MSIEAIAFVKRLDLGRAKRASLLLYVIAENTFNDSFRCVLGHAQLGYEAGRQSVRTMSRQLKLLETNSIIRRRPRFNSEGGRTFDEIEIVGFREWYAANHPKRAQAAGAKPSNEPDAKLAGGENETPPMPECPIDPVQPDNLAEGGNRTPVSGGCGQQVAGSYKESRTSSVQEEDNTPLTPRTRGEDFLNDLFEELRISGASTDLIDHFLVPLCTGPGAIRLSHRDPRGLVREVCGLKELHALPHRALAEIARILRSERSKLSQAKNVTDVLSRALTQVPKIRIVPQMTEQWAAWMAHYKAQVPASHKGWSYATYCEKQGWFSELTEFPPGHWKFTRETPASLRPKTEQAA